MRDWLNGAPLEGGKGNPSGKNAEITLGKDGDSAKKGERVVVVHCKAGKGRSGTMACSYLIAECGWTPDDALARFTERRMRPRFGAGVSIPSQLRWISYVDRWTRGGKRFVDRRAEVVEVHIWGLRHGVKVSVEGFVDEGKRIKTFHTFSKGERIVVEAGAPGGAGFVDFVSDMAGYGSASPTAGAGKDGEETVEELKDVDIVGGDEAEDDDKNNGTPSKLITGARATATLLKMARSKSKHGSSNISSSSASLNKLDHNTKSKTIAITSTSTTTPSKNQTDSPPSAGPTDAQSLSQSSLPLNPSSTFASDSEPGGQAVILRPAAPIQLEGGDVRIALERRNRAAQRLGAGWAVVTAVAHVWFNAFFEGGGPENAGQADDEGVFDIEWDAMDGIKGSSAKGSRACDRIAVVWRVVGGEAAEEGGVGRPPGIVVGELAEGTAVPQMRPADWKGVHDVDPEGDKHLGLRVEEPDSEAVSKASSIKSQEAGEGVVERSSETEAQDDDSIKGVKTSGPSGEEVLDGPLEDKTTGMEDAKGEGPGSQG
jgi:hypothetical protein